MEVAEKTAQQTLQHVHQPDLRVEMDITKIHLELLVIKMVQQTVQLANITMEVLGVNYAMPDFIVQEDRIAMKQVI